MTLKTAENQKGEPRLTFEQINPYLLKPSPENAKIYRPILRDDPEVRKLADSIKVNGITPLVISADGFIISGHRRREAAIMAGLMKDGIGL